MSLCCEVALVCQNHFRNCEILYGIGLLVRNHAFSFRNAFRSCEIDATILRSGTRVPNPLSQLRNALRKGTFGAKSCFSTSQWVSQLPNGCYCTAKWHSCAKSTFAAAKYTRRGFYSSAEWFGNKNHISQRFPSPCEISQSSVFPLFLLYFGSNFDPIFSFNLLEIYSTWNHSKRLKHT